jgi:hypothetical protein
METDWLNFKKVMKWNLKNGNYNKFQKTWQSYANFEKIIISIIASFKTQKEK